MFDANQLQRVLQLHDRSYALLRWVQGALRSGKLSFATVHAGADSAAAAEEWIRRHWDNLPHDVRPGETGVRTFAHLFASFLTTSFELTPTTATVRSDCGCWCRFCTYLQTSSGLKPRNPSRRERDTAQALKEIYLTQLASSVGIAESRLPSMLPVLLSDAALREPIAIATWAAELLRRAEFASQGEAVLALWREFAWENGNPRRGFKLTPKQVDRAEQAIAARLKSG